MGEYLVDVVVMSVTLGLISYLSYPSAAERVIRFAVSVLLLYTVLSPAANFLSNIGNEDNFYISTDLPELDESNEYINVARNAFCDGISKLLFTKYGLSDDEARVSVIGFEFENMKAEKINITLVGSGVFADYRDIESYITESGLGECEVEISFG